MKRLSLPIFVVAAALGIGISALFHSTPQQRLELAVVEANKPLPRTQDGITVIRAIVYDKAASELRYMFEITDADFEFTSEVTARMKKDAIETYNLMPENARALIDKVEVRVFCIYSRAGTELAKIAVH